MKELLIIAPSLLFGGIALLFGWWQPVVAFAVTLWGALLGALFAIAFILTLPL